MKKSYLLILAALVAGGIALFFLQNRSGLTTIVSSDGKATLEISKEALPEGLRLSDISVEPIASGDLPFSSKDAASLMGYRLEPDGLQLLRPAQLDFKLENNDGDIPIFLHFLGSDMEVVSGVHYNLSHGEMLAQVPIMHFSDVVHIIGKKAPFKLVALASEDVALGENVKATMLIRQVGAEYELESPDGSKQMLQLVNGSEKVKGSISIAGRDPLALSPVSVDNRPPLSVFEQIFTVHSSDFTCQNLGSDSLVFKTSVQWKYRLVGDSSLDFSKTEFPAWFWVDIETNEISCVGGSKEPASCQERGLYQSQTSCSNDCGEPAYCERTDNDCWNCVGVPNECQTDSDCGQPHCDDADQVYPVCERNVEGVKVCTERTEPCPLGSVCTADIDSAVTALTSPLKCVMKEYSSTCGNGIAEPGEDCDGKDLAGLSCQLLGFDGGSLSCNSDCKWDLNKCYSGERLSCGNGVLDSNEECDGPVIFDKCEDFGFYGGEMRCNADCTLNKEYCWTQRSVCGNGIREGQEECDQQDLSGKTCSDLGLSGGPLQCDGQCFFDNSLCTFDYNVCGDGAVVQGEDCDGDNLAGATCESKGFSGGNLTCNPECKIDTSDCKTASPQPEKKPSMKAVYLCNLCDIAPGGICPTITVNSPEECAAAGGELAVDSAQMVPDEGEDSEGRVEGGGF